MIPHDFYCFSSQDVCQIEVVEKICLSYNRLEIVGKYFVKEKNKEVFIFWDR